MRTRRAVAGEYLQSIGHTLFTTNGVQRDTGPTPFHGDPATALSFGDAGHQPASHPVQVPVATATLAQLGGPR